MVFAGVKRIDKPIQANSDLASINTKAKTKAAENGSVNAENKAEKPKRRRKADK